MYVQLYITFCMFNQVVSMHRSLYLRILGIGFASIRMQVVDLQACAWKVHTRSA